MPQQTVLILGGQGYVGSAVSARLLASGFGVESVDEGLRGTPGPARNRPRRFQDLAPGELGVFSAVVLLAGHSSVGACAGAPAEAFSNNVSAFVDLVHKLRGAPLIYASSISIYGRTGGRAATEDDPLPEPIAVYDLHKQLIERYARFAYPNAYGLRFGSVCGPSPNLRPELLLNNMVRSALRRGKIELANPHAHRPILGINDLGRAVEAILTRPVPPGCYNIASESPPIGELAEWVARRFGVPVEEIVSPTPYDVRVSSDRFRAAADFEFRDTIAGLTDDLVAHYAAERL